jgi:hypothetical protein
MAVVADGSTDVDEGEQALMPKAVAAANSSTHTRIRRAFPACVMPWAIAIALLGVGLHPLFRMLAMALRALKPDETRLTVIPRREWR